MEQFRSISCVNSLYKIHAKIIADQLVVMVLELILGDQAAFVRGMHIEELFKLAKEMMRGFG